jgi:hypothetical protein
MTPPAFNFLGRQGPIPAACSSRHGMGRDGPVKIGFCSTRDFCNKIKKFLIEINHFSSKMLS